MAHFSPEDVKKLKQIITEGMHITEEVNVLKEGLKDTVAAIAEELDVKPAILNKAIRIVGIVSALWRTVAHKILL
jgi:hypothetical protein